MNKIRKLSFSFSQWARLSWRRQSLVIAVFAMLTGFAMVGAVVSLWHVERAPLRLWVSMTMIPFGFVVMLGVIARLQQKIDLRAGRNATRPTDLIEEAQSR